MRGPYETPCPRQTPSRCTHLRSRMHRARTCRCSNFVPSSAHDSDNAAQRAHRVPTSTPRRPEAASIRVPEPSAASTSAAAEVNATNRTAGLPATEDFYLQQPKPLRPLPWYHYKVERKAHDTAPSDLLMSRVAMVSILANGFQVGFSVSIAAEALTGRGPLSQLNIETGIPLAEIDGIVVFLIAFNVATVLFPRRRDASYFPEEEELEPESSGILFESSRKARRIVRKIRKRQLSRNDLGTLVPRPLRWLARLRRLGTPEGPSQREIESLVGRCAQLGFSGCLLVEALSGKGPLAQLGWERMLLVDEAEPLVLLVVAIVSSSLVWSKQRDETPPLS